MPLTKHLEECLQILQQLKMTPFQAIDLFPKIKRADFVLKKLVEAGEVSKFYVGEEAFYQVNAKKAQQTDCTKPLKWIK